MQPAGSWDTETDGRKKKGQREIILIICPSLTNPYYATLIQGMEQEAKGQGYTTIIYTTYWDKEEEQAAPRARARIHESPAWYFP